jgi:diguanylate cyclase (GGDEF)-like protein/PAS domain S-box-containing protein
VPAAARVRPAPTPMQTTDEPDGSPTEDGEDADRAEAREEQFRTLAENIPGVATFLDRIQDDPGHSIPLYISPQVEPMLGYPLHEWLDESELWLRILHPEDRDRLVAADENARKHKLPLSEEYRLLHRDGHVVWVSERAAVVPDVSTGTLYWQGVMVDITKRRRAEQAMADSELKFRTLFDAAAIGVFTLALDGRITEANATIEWLGRYDEGALTGVALADLVEPDDEEILDDLAELRAGHRDRCRAEHRFRRKDGSFLWCRTVVTLVRGPDLLPLYAMGMLEDISARKLVEDELLHRAVHDVLTGLPNRQLLLDRLTMALARTAREPDVGATLVFLDLDDFKDVNDTFGHGAGDELLIQVAERLSAAVRPSDTVARYGGDEFVVIFVGDVSKPGDARLFAERLAEQLKEPFTIAGHQVTTTASLGVASCADGNARPEDVIREADAAMYRAKLAGRDRIELSGSLGPSPEPLAR